MNQRPWYNDCISGGDEQAKITDKSKIPLEVGKLPTSIPVAIRLPLTSIGGVELSTPNNQQFIAA